MNRGIIILLGAIVVIGLAAMYVLQRGPSLFVNRPAEQRIAFVSDRSGHPDIWTMRTDGTDKRRVTDDPADDGSPAWSPDSTEILSISSRDENRYQIFASAWDGRYTKRLTVGTGTKGLPCWRWDGKEIAFLSSGEVHVLKRHGGSVEQILPSMEQGDVYRQPPYVYVAWSPKRRALTVIQDTDVGQVALALEDLHKKPFGLTIAGSLTVAWAPSGGKIAAAFVDRVGQNGVLVADLETVEAKDILITERDSIGPGALAWSPDGRLIAFEMWEIKRGRRDRCVGIYVVDSSGGEPRPLVEGDAQEPRWDPDGKYLVYTLARPDGKRDIWRIDADGSGALNLTGGSGDNYNPDWSPSSRGAR